MHITRFITSKGLRIFALIAIVGLVVVSLTRYFGPAASQAKNLAAAREHASRLEPEIHHDSRFADIKLGAYTGGGGCLWVYGFLTSDQVSNDLSRLVEASHPPVPVQYDIRILPPEPGTTNQ